MRKKKKKDWKESANVDDYSDDSYVYFTKETHDKICEYVHNNLSEFERKKIYEKYIYPAFDELIKIQINTFNFYYTGVPQEALVQEVNVRMYEVLEESRMEDDKYYDESYGSSYSYFSRVAKNYMIQKQTRHQKNKKKYGMESINDDEAYFVETYYEEPTDIDLSEFIEYLNLWLENNIDIIFDKKEDKQVAWSILEILQNDNIEINNKKLFYYMIKDQFGDDDYRINKVLNIFKEYYDAIKNEYLETFYVNTKKIE